jgi:hypothetical protein
MKEIKFKGYNKKTHKWEDFTLIFDDAIDYIKPFVNKNDIQEAAWHYAHRNTTLDEDHIIFKQIKKAYIDGAERLLRTHLKSENNFE